MESYRQGDKSVLPALLRVGYLGGFYGESVASDPEGFLTELVMEPESLQESVAQSMAGGMFGLPRSRFDAIRTALTRIPEQSASHGEAQRCLKILDAANAALLANYFPPHTFSGAAAEFTERWYARELYALAERPLWPAPVNDVVYRFTWLRSFNEPVAVTLTSLADGSGQLRLRVTDHSRQHLTVDRTIAVTAEQVATVAEIIDQAQFWRMPTQQPDHGLDGSEWILEGTKSGNYHIVTRWCAGKTPFGKAAFNLISLSGYELTADKIY